MSVLDRDALAASPLADLHAIASEIGLEGFRRLRKADLVEAIVAHQAAEPEPEPALELQPALEPEPEDAEDRPRKRRRRGGRSRARSRDADPEAAEPVEAAPAPAPAEEESEPVVEGTVELLGNGSAFLRLTPPEPSDDDVYLSAAQVRRCELVSGDRVAGPVRRPRRSERYPSLIRVDTINGVPADQVAEGTPYDDLPAAFPSERLGLERAEDPTLTAIELIAPFGKGSRVVVAGPSRTGKTDTLRRLVAALHGREGLEVLVALAGTRPEEIAEWQSGPVPPATATSFAHSPEAQAQALEPAVEQARRVAARGGDVVLVVDALDGLPPAAARRVLAAARNIVDGGSLTVVAAAPQPFGGETTVVALDPRLAGAGRFPALDPLRSGTLRPELLVGDAGAAAGVAARAQALGRAG